MIYSASEIQRHDVRTEIDGKWVLTRPLNYRSFKKRIKEAWMVFIGKADVLVWYKQ
jgi:hypothetical protein